MSRVSWYSGMPDAMPLVPPLTLILVSDAPGPTGSCSVLAYCWWPGSMTISPLDSSAYSAARSAVLPAAAVCPSEAVSAAAAVRPVFPASAACVLPASAGFTAAFCSVLPACAGACCVMAVPVFSSEAVCVCVPCPAEFPHPAANTSTRHRAAAVFFHIVFFSFRAVSLTARL